MKKSPSNITGLDLFIFLYSAVLAAEFATENKIDKVILTAVAAFIIFWARQPRKTK